jgi:excinuclease ABC subunit C
MTPDDIDTFLKTVTTLPGVYQMLDKQGKIIYVGKAHNLKRRIASYFQKTIVDAKTTALLEHVHSIKTIITQTENEALILENNLIKKLRPNYNIEFRDDKSYPYIYISADTFARMIIYRGKKKEKGQYFGPYPSAVAIRNTLNLLQKLFQIRPCKNNFFKSRTRPCLLHQIKRCSAPCVNLIDTQNYAKNVQCAILFLQGKNDVIVRQLEKQMDNAALHLQYELAAQYRNQIQYLREIQNQQYSYATQKDIDIIVIAEKDSIICLYLLIIRHGEIIGSKNFFPKLLVKYTNEELLTTFIMQYYASNIEQIPKIILTNYKPNNLQALKNILSSQANRKINLQYRMSGIKKQWLNTAILNARQTLNTHILSTTNLLQKFRALQQVLGLKILAKNIACFDVSHTMGEATVASCVVFNLDGPVKNNYRKFNITNVTPGDDIAAMKQAISRYFAHSKKTKISQLPDILIVDGGKSQLNQAISTLKELHFNNITILAVAKGITRKPGNEILYLSSRAKPLKLTEDNSALHLIQQIRDEAHRFAITGHKKRRDKIRTTSLLENIPNVGTHRRQALLKYFGGLQGILKASISDLAKTPGINRKLAQKIYEFLH